MFSISSPSSFLWRLQTLIPLSTTTSDGVFEAFGKKDDEEDIENFDVMNCTFSGTSDGVRIKTWAF